MESTEPQELGVNAECRIQMPLGLLGFEQFKSLSDTLAPVIAAIFVNVPALTAVAKTASTADWLGYNVLKVQMSVPGS